jgi:cytidylate kinase
MSYVQVAIDGPAVSGKSSAAKRLAHRLGWLYLDSGAIYRSITLAVLRGFSLSGEDLESRLDALGICLRPLGDEPGCSVWMKDEDISEAIRTQHVTDHIRPISGSPRVRDWVTEELRQMSKGADVIMDGRDIASVVFPDAQHKFFVTASLEARVKRRLADLGSSESVDPAELRTLLEQRDQSDRERKIGPLVQVPEAVLIDNSELGLEDTVARMISEIRKETQKEI